MVPCWSSQVLAAVVALTAGCAIVYDGIYDHDEGWRIGRIVRIGTAAEMADLRVAACKNSVDRQYSSAQRVALVRYPALHRGYKHMLLPLPADPDLVVGAEVYVNRHQCATPPTRRPRALGQPPPLAGGSG